MKLIIIIFFFFDHLNIFFFFIDFTISYLQKYGFIIPLLFKDKTGLGLHVPSPNFSVNDVRTCVGKYNNGLKFKLSNE